MAAEAEYRLIATALDTSFYRAIYDDVALARADPVRHYLDEGWREGRDPAPWFSTMAYLETHPDVGEAGLNPFHHYLAQGWREGREVAGSSWRGAWLLWSAREGRSPEWTYEPPTAQAHARPRVEGLAAAEGEDVEALGFRWRIIDRMVPVAERVGAAMLRAARIPARPLPELEAALARGRRASDGALHVSVSHDNYLSNTGGVQLCLQREAAAIAARGADHLHLYPTTHWPTLRGADQPAPIGVLWNGQDLGAFTAASLASALARGRAGAQMAGGRRSFALHSLLGHSVDDILAILAAAGLESGYFWLHDFTSLCAGVHLLRNDVADCAAPPAGSPACGICAYGPWRAAHVEAHTRLFAALDLTVVAPSQSAFDTWRAATTAPKRQAHRIHPHARLTPRGPAPIPPEGPLTIAFLGMPSAHKGWPAFCDLAARFEGDARYRFVHLASAPGGGAAEFHPVAVTAASPLAMREALDEVGVDVAILWSLCRETFSFTAYEAAAAGVAILTGPDSGNIAAFVAGEGFGRVLADEAALSALFESGEALSLARRARNPSAYDIAYGALSVDLMGTR